MDTSLHEDLRKFFQSVIKLTTGLKQLSNYREANIITVKERVHEDKVWYYIPPEELGAKRSRRGITIREDPMPRFNELRSDGKGVWSIHNIAFDARLSAFNESPLSWDWQVALEAVWIHAFISLMRDIRNFTGTSELFPCLTEKQAIWKVFAETEFETILHYYQDYLFEEQGIIIDVLFQVPRVPYKKFNSKYIGVLRSISQRRYNNFDIQVPEEQLKTDLRAVLNSELMKSTYETLWVTYFHYNRTAFENAYSTLVKTHMDTFRFALLPTPCYGVTLSSNIILIDSEVENIRLLYGKVTGVFLHEFSHALCRWNCQNVREFLERCTPHPDPYPVVRYHDAFLDWLDSSMPLKHHLEAGDQFETMLFGETLKVLNLSSAGYLMDPNNLKLPLAEFTLKFAEKNREHLTDRSMPSIPMNRDQTRSGATVLGHCFHHDRQ